jgi:hypothetical protein
MVSEFVKKSEQNPTHLEILIRKAIDFAQYIVKFNKKKDWEGYQFPFLMAAKILGENQ